MTPLTRRFPLRARLGPAPQARCLAAVQKIFDDDRDKTIAALIVEPILSEGGDIHASPDFFRKVQAVVRRAGAKFIVDEVQTGVGATGHFWAHEAWGLEAPPDAVTFSKKSQVAGFYCTDELVPKARRHGQTTTPTRPLLPLSSLPVAPFRCRREMRRRRRPCDRHPQAAYRIFNTWMGDPARLLQFEAVLECVKKARARRPLNLPPSRKTMARCALALITAGLRPLRHQYGLVENAAITGKVLQDGLKACFWLSQPPAPAAVLPASAVAGG